MRVIPVGARGLLVEVDDPAAWFTALTRRRSSGDLAVVEIVAGARSVLLDGLADPAATAAALPSWAPAAHHESLPGATVEIPVRFDGPDLDFVADLWAAEVATILCGASLHVAFGGFAPGFAYLVGLPPDLAVPRLPTPRSRVEPGSVALADNYAGVYPSASPGGWRIVGHTELTLFDPHRDPPALLQPGTRVRFVAATP